MKCIAKKGEISAVWKWFSCFKTNNSVSLKKEIFCHLKTGQRQMATKLGLVFCLLSEALFAYQCCQGLADLGNLGIC